MVTIFLALQVHDLCRTTTSSTDSRCLLSKGSAVVGLYWQPEKSAGSPTSSRACRASPGLGSNQHSGLKSFLKAFQHDKIVFLLVIINCNREPNKEVSQANNISNIV